MNEDEQARKLANSLRRLGLMTGFKKELLSGPAATLKAEGVALPHELQVRAVENTDKLVYLVIPAKPTELSEEDLEKVAGGTIGYTQPPPCVASVLACIILPGK